MPKFRFLKHAFGLNPGEIATFEGKDAERLLAAKAVVIVEEPPPVEDRQIDSPVNRMVKGKRK